MFLPLMSSQAKQIKWQFKETPAFRLGMKGDAPFTCHAWTPLKHWRNGGYAKNA